MREYISREYLLAEYDRQHQGPPGGARKIIVDAPAADVAEVRHGKWIQKGRKIYCSKCNRGVYIGTDDEGLMQDEMRLRHFCSACGAKMEGGQDE